MRKGDGVDGQWAKVMGNFTTKDEGEESSSLHTHAFNSAAVKQLNVPVGDKVNEIIMTRELTLV